MALTKEIKIDKIEIVENGGISVRRVTTIMEDDTELSSTYHRTTLAPGSDVSSQPQNVQDICAAVWTAEVVAAYNAKVAASLAAMTPAAE